MNIVALVRTQQRKKYNNGHVIVFDHSLVVPDLFHNEGYNLNFRSGIVSL
jgi:hypothetical protein